jgi:uroporphyrinogen-III synthase
MQVLLTHSSGKLETLEPALVALGCNVSHRPAIITHTRFDGLTRTHAEALLECPWLVFTSRSAVTAWQQLGLPLEGNIAAVGDKTARALERAAAQVALTAQQQNAADLAKQLIERVTPCEVGLPQGNMALGVLEQRLRQAGFSPRPVIIYQTEIQAPLSLAELEHIDAVVLASPSAVQVLPAGLPARVSLVSFGDSTSKALASRGYTYAPADTPSSEAVVRLIRRLLEDRQ